MNSLNRLFLPFVLLCAGWAATAAQPTKPSITLEDFQLIGDLSGDSAEFTLSAKARVNDSKGGSIDLLSGPVALLSVEPNPKVHLGVSQNRYTLTFDRRGEYLIRLKFSASVIESDGWKRVSFGVAPGALQKVVMGGLAAGTQFQFAGAARPERRGSDFVSYLPADGAVKLSWREVGAETQGKLFFSADMLAQVNVSPGLMWETALLHFKVMQGELNEVTLRLRGAGEITRVQGDQVLAWDLESITNSADRQLVIKLNQPQKDQFSIQVQAQTPLGAFPAVG